MYTPVEILVILTAILTQGLRNLLKPPSAVMPYMALAVAWGVTFLSMAVESGFTFEVARIALSDCLVVWAAAVVTYDMGIKPLQKWAERREEVQTNAPKDQG